MNPNPPPSETPVQAVDPSGAAAQAAANDVRVAFDSAVPAGAGGYPPTGEAVGPDGGNGNPRMVDPARGAALVARLLKLGDTMCARVYMDSAVAATGDRELSARLAASNLFSEDELKELADTGREALELWGLGGYLRPDLVFVALTAAHFGGWWLAFGDLKRRTAESKKLAAESAKRET